MRRRGDRLVEGVRQAGENGLATVERRGRGAASARSTTDGERRVRDRTRVEARHLETRLGQQLRGEAADLAETENRDCREQLRRPPSGLRAMPRADQDFSALFAGS